jgi:ribosomal protein S26
MKLVYPLCDPIWLRQLQVVWTNLPNPQTALPLPLPKPKTRTRTKRRNSKKTTKGPTRTVSGDEEDQVRPLDAALVRTELQALIPVQVVEASTIAVVADRTSLAIVVPSVDVRLVAVATVVVVE